jgi:hypothetical protein
MEQPMLNFIVRHMLSNLRNTSYKALTIDVSGMKLGHLENEKEAQALQIARALLVAQGGKMAIIAQTLLARIARCLELQGNNDRTDTNGSRR